MRYLKASKPLVAMVLAALLAACTAHYTVNNNIATIEPVKRYSLQYQAGSEKSDELLLILTFSGGGTRAAALSYGVLQTLANTQITIGGQRRRLLDEVDLISSVSGGSFTSAYYGLFGDRIFEDFETRFLKRNVEGDLALGLISPKNWPKLMSSYYARSDFAADFFDDILFEKKTFADFKLPQLPLIAINATDIALGTQFTFLGFQFAPICTDLSSYPVSRAVTASASVPGPFSSIVLKNYAGTCDYQLPHWAANALHEGPTTTRRYQDAKTLSSYMDVEKYTYIHLFDGGLSDNLGVRFILNYTARTENIQQQMAAMNLQKTKKLAIIAVNARNRMATDFAKERQSAPIIDTIGLISSIPLDRYSFDTMDLLRRNIKGWEDAVTKIRCKNLKIANSHKESGTTSPGPDCAFKSYLIEVSLDQTPTESERQKLLSLPTSFYLKPDDIDRLRTAARDLLSSSAEFQHLVLDLQH
ncbi:MAG: patatin-like phospholipase family protein [Desulfobacterales bacterium]|nr:patatin-like phospholipase family protein [Desulfobacterales bacterium]